MKSIDQITVVKLTGTATKLLEWLPTQKIDHD